LKGSLSIISYYPKYAYSSGARVKSFLAILGYLAMKNWVGVNQSLSRPGEKLLPESIVGYLVLAT